MGGSQGSGPLPESARERAVVAGGRPPHRSARACSACCDYTEAYLDAELGSLEDLQGQAWTEIAVQVPLQALGATMMAVAYFLLRKGKENIDAEEIAAVFD